MQTGTTTLEDSLAVFYKTKAILPCSSLIGILDVYPKAFKTYVHTKNCTLKLRAALLIIVKT